MGSEGKVDNVNRSNFRFSGNAFLRSISCIGTVFMIFAATNAILNIVFYGANEGSIFMRVEFPILGVHYQPTALNVLTGFFMYFLFYKKFKWRSIFVFSFILGTEDLLAIIEFSLYRLIVFNGAGIDPLGVTLWWVSLGIDTCFIMMGAFIVRPRFNFKLTKGKCVGLTWVIVGTAYIVAVGAIGYGDSDLLLNFVSWATIFGLLLFLYQVVEIDKREPQLVTPGKSVK